VNTSEQKEGNYMKKVLTLIVLSLIPVLALAQGTIYPLNQTGVVKQWTSWNDPTLISVPTNGGYVQVIAAPKGTPLSRPLFTPWSYGALPNFTSLSSFLAANPGWNLASVYYDVTPAPPIQILYADGIFLGDGLTLNNIAAGAEADYFVVGWTGNYASFDAALNNFSGFLGASAIATTSTGDPTATPPDVPVSLKSTFPGMTLAPLVIPEPTTVALAGLGAAALMVFRRRR
jgi:hypothetical protein